MTAYDLLIRNAEIVDGTGKPRYRADLAVKGMRIAAVGDLKGSRAAEEIDAKGLALAPGFIDVHTHDDGALLDTPDMSMKISQGVTTVIAGNCGISAAPLDPTAGNNVMVGLLFRGKKTMCERLGDYLANVDAAHPATNAAFLVGHSTLRMDSMGEDLNRQASPAETARMRARLQSALDDGAIGLSSGLFYPPAMAATQQEVATVAEPLGPAGGVYTAHIRDEGEHIVDALKEAFAIGRHAQCMTVISHHKCSGRTNFGRSVETLPMFEQAAKSQPVAFDVYPYIAGSTILRPEMVERAERVMITWSKAMPQHTARYLDEIAKEMNCSMLEAAAKLQPAGAIYFMMDEADVQRIMAHKMAMIGSDGIPSDSHPHPRLWGTFPRVLGHYVRDLKLFGLEDGVHRMTGLSAQRFGLTGRGELMVGAYADLVLFDPGTIADRATFEQPKQPASGIAWVAVNGQIVWRDGRATGARPGLALRRQAMQAERAA